MDGGHSPPYGTARQRKEDCSYAFIALWVPAERLLTAAAPRNPCSADMRAMPTIAQAFVGWHAQGRLERVFQREGARQRRHGQTSLAVPPGIWLVMGNVCQPRAELSSSLRWYPKCDKRNPSSGKKPIGKGRKALRIPVRE